MNRRYLLTILLFVETNYSAILFNICLTSGRPLISQETIVKICILSRRFAFCHASLLGPQEQSIVGRRRGRKAEISEIFYNLCGNFGENFPQIMLHQKGLGYSCTV